MLWKKNSTLKEYFSPSDNYFELVNYTQRLIQTVHAPRLTKEITWMTSSGKISNSWGSHSKFVPFCTVKTAGRGALNENGQAEEYLIKSVECNLGEFPKRQEFICPCNNLPRKWDIWFDTGEIKSGKTTVSMPLETIQEAEYVQDET